MTLDLPTDLQALPFTFRQAVTEGLNQYGIRRLLDSGMIERIERGVYQAVGVDLSEPELFRRATKKIGGPAAVCLLSALSHYGITDTIPKQVWLMVPSNKRSASPHIKLYRARDPKWQVGIVVEDGYNITSIERTIVDTLTHKAILAPRVGIDALKTAITQKLTTASKIIDMSKALGVTHRILPYLEALS